MPRISEDASEEVRDVIDAALARHNMPRSAVRGKRTARSVQMLLASAEPLPADAAWDLYQEAHKLQILTRREGRELFATIGRAHGAVAKGQKIGVIYPDSSTGFAELLASAIVKTFPALNAKKKRADLEATIAKMLQWFEPNPKNADFDRVWNALTIALQRQPAGMKRCHSAIAPLRVTVTDALPMPGNRQNGSE